MKMLFVLILVLGAVAAENSDESRRRLLCGRDLAKAHSLYCDNLDPAPEDTAGFELAKPQAATTAATRMVPERFSHKLRRSAEVTRRREALVEVCCTRPCLISELLEHC